jgi:hypothetical protein
MLSVQHDGQWETQHHSTMIHAPRSAGLCVHWPCLHVDEASNDQECFVIYVVHNGHRVRDGAVTRCIEGVHCEWLDSGVGVKPTLQLGHLRNDMALKAEGCLCEVYIEANAVRSISVDE